MLIRIPGCTAFIAIACVALAAPAAHAQIRAPRVEEQFGNVIYDGADGVQRQLTNEHIDGTPTLSPDGRTVAFIRIEGRGTEGSPDFTALWIADGLTATKRRLMGPRPSQEPKSDLQSFRSPEFSLDGGFIYVIADAWATSGAIHQIDIAHGTERFVIDGSSDQVIRTGPYRGYLLVERHKYHPAPEYGSYNPVDVVRPDGQVALTVPGTEIDDGVDRVTPWLAQHGWTAW